MHDPYAAGTQRVGAPRSTRRPAGVGRAAVTAIAAVLFFAAAADGLGVVLQLIGVMPLVP